MVMSVMSSVMDTILMRRKAKGLSPDGSQAVVSNTPVAKHVRHRAQPSMFELVREAVRSEALRRDVDSQELDTFEESQDFGDEDDESALPETAYERASRRGAERQATRDRLAELRRGFEEEAAIDRQLNKARQGGPEKDRPAAGRDVARPRTAAPVARRPDLDAEEE